MHVLCMPRCDGREAIQFGYPGWAIFAVRPLIEVSVGESGSGDAGEFKSLCNCTSWNKLTQISLRWSENRVSFLFPRIFISILLTILKRFIYAGNCDFATGWEELPYIIMRYMTFPLPFQPIRFPPDISRNADSEAIHCDSEVIGFWSLRRFPHHEMEGKLFGDSF